MRSVLYPYLEADAGLNPVFRWMRCRGKYGRLVDTSDIANKREPIFARHDAGDTISKDSQRTRKPQVQRGITLSKRKAGNLTDSDAQVNSAIDRFRNPTQTPLIPALEYYRRL